LSHSRIAAAIKAADNDYAIDQTSAYLNLADAVIRELGLRQERQQGPYNHMYRYVTEFESKL
jgi:hypothetical protein